VIKYSYHREQLDLLMLFTSAFDDTFVYRYDFNTKNPESKIQVRYIHGPKQRVIHDIVTKEKNLTLPVVSIEQTGLSRDPDRVVHKHQNIYRPLLGNVSKVGKIPTPIPVIMDVKVSIIAKYKEDIDQIIQNFATVCNPYFVVSWKIPEEFGLDFTDELRVQIEWAGNISYTTPTTLGIDDKYRISADTTFTIKGWLFPSLQNPEAPIYVVNTKFINQNLASRVTGYDDYPSLSASYVESDTVMVSAYPEFTNFYYSVSGDIIPLLAPARFNYTVRNNFLILGKRFGYNNTWYLSSSKQEFLLDFVEIKTAKFPIISAYKIPENLITTYTDNNVTISIPENFLSGSSGDFTIVTANSAGWTSSKYKFSIDDINNKNMYIQPDLISTYYQPNSANTYIRP
jgi:hypothetical protein